MTTLSNQDAFAEGVKAYANHEENLPPYPSGDSRREYWQRGWEKAKERVMKVCWGYT